MEQETKQTPQEKQKNSIRGRIIDCLLYNKDFFETADFIRTAIEKKEFEDFTESEMEWMFSKLELIGNIKNNEYACSVFYWLLKGQEIKRNFSRYFIAKKLGVYEKTVLHWINVFRRNGLLIETKRRTIGTKVITDYFFNPKLIKVVDLIYDVIQREMGNKLLKIANKEHNVQWVSIEKWRKKNPEKAKKHHNLYRKRY